MPNVRSQFDLSIFATGSLSIGRNAAKGQSIHMKWVDGNVGTILDVTSGRRNNKALRILLLLAWAPHGHAASISLSAADALWKLGGTRTLL